MLFKLTNFVVPESDFYIHNRQFFDPDHILMNKQQLHLESIQKKDGTPFSNRESMASRGCWVSARIHGQDGSTSQPIQGFLLVDTGSNCCVIRGDIADQLGIKPDENPSEHRGTTDGVEQSAQWVNISVDELDLCLKLPRIRLFRGKGLEHWKKNHPDNFIGLLGTDVLAHCKLVYDGVNATASLEETDKEVDCG